MDALLQPILTLGSSSVLQVANVAADKAGDAKETKK
jgi:hypothetical protein